MPQDGAVEEQSRCSGEIEARKDLHASLEFEIWKSCFLKCFFVVCLWEWDVGGYSTSRRTFVEISSPIGVYRRVDTLLSFGTLLSSKFQSASQDPLSPAERVVETRPS